MAERKRVLVAGATGYLGGYVVRDLHNTGYFVRAISRKKHNQDLSEICDDIAVCEATKKESVQGVCKDIDVVISSLGIRTFKSKPTFNDVDFGANMNLLEDAIKCGVKHFIFVSVLKGNQFRDKIPGMNARERVADAIKESGLRYTIARPNGFFNDMEGMFLMAEADKFMLIGSGDITLNPIHGEDLAKELVDSIEDENRWNKEFDIGGPDIFSMKQIGELAFRELGKKPKFIKIQPSIIKFFSAILAPFNENGSYILSAMALLGSLKKMEAPKYGSHHLKDFFRELAKDKRR